MVKGAPPAHDTSAFAARKATERLWQRRQPADAERVGADACERESASVFLAERMRSLEQFLRSVASQDLVWDLDAAT